MKRTDVLVALCAIAASFAALSSGDTDTDTEDKRIAQLGPLAQECARGKAAACQDLANIAKTDSAARVRQAAVEELLDRAVLAQVARDDEVAIVRWTAVRRAGANRLTDQAVLAEIAKADKDPSVRGAAAEELTDQAALAQIAKTDSDANVRSSAISRLKDPKALAFVAENDSATFNRAHALARLSDSPTSCRVVARLIPRLKAEAERLKKASAEGDGASAVEFAFVQGPIERTEAALKKIQKMRDLARGALVLLVVVGATVVAMTKRRHSQREGANVFLDDAPQENARNTLEGPSLLSWNGTSGRRAFGLLFFAGLLLMALGFLATIDAPGPIRLATAIVLGWPLALTATVRRLGDLSKAKWAAFVALAPFASNLAVPYLLLAPKSSKHADAAHRPMSDGNVAFTLFLVVLTAGAYVALELAR